MSVFHVCVSSEMLVMQLTSALPRDALHTSGKESRTSLTASGSQEGEGCALERRQEVEELPEPDSHRVLVAELKKQMVTQLDSCHAEALSSSAAAGDSARPKINLLNILHQGWNLRSVCLHPGLLLMC